MSNSEILKEIERLNAEFANADERKRRVLDPLIEQAAHERIYLKKLNEQALQTGLVKFNPSDTSIQRALPVSGEIAKHSATLTNIMDKLMKHLAVDVDDEDDGLSDYE